MSALRRIDPRGSFARVDHHRAGHMWSRCGGATEMSVRGISTGAAEQRRPRRCPPPLRRPRRDPDVVRVRTPPRRPPAAGASRVACERVAGPPRNRLSAAGGRTPYRSHAASNAPINLRGVLVASDRWQRDQHPDVERDRGRRDVPHRMGFDRGHRSQAESPSAMSPSGEFRPAEARDGHRVVLRGRRTVRTPPCARRMSCRGLFRSAVAHTPGCLAPRRRVPPRADRRVAR